MVSQLQERHWQKVADVLGEGLQPTEHVFTACPSLAAHFAGVCRQRGSFMLPLPVPTCIYPCDYTDGLLQVPLRIACSHACCGLTCA